MSGFHVPFTCPVYMGDIVINNDTQFFYVCGNFLVFDVVQMYPVRVAAITYVLCNLAKLNTRIWNEQTVGHSQKIAKNTHYVTLFKNT